MLTDIVPAFGGVVWTLAAFVVALSVIVAIHEYGHYIVGRWTGIRAEVFSIGMGPVLLSRTDRRGTRWQIAALPIGGYVRFAGDADPASMARADPHGSAPRDTMAGAPLWARAATVAAGPIFNFILSILIFAGILLAGGVASDPLTVDEVRPLPAATQELRPGDEILSIAGQDVPPLEELGGFLDTIPDDPLLDYRVRRDGDVRTIAAPYPYPPLIGGVTPGSAADAAGLREGDVIVAAAGREVASFDALREVVGASGGAPIELRIWNPEGGERTETLTPRRTDLPAEGGGFETRYLIGITGGLFFTPETRTPGPFAAIAHGADRTLFVIESSLSGLYNMVIGAISTCNLSGPVGIAQASGATAAQGITAFIGFIAVLSTAVGLLNLFPIPVLDGGHLVFHAYEAVAGKPPSDRALRALMSVGFALLIGLMVFAVTNDLFCP